MEKKVTNSKGVLKELKKMKKGDTLVWDERFENENKFEITYGNLMVLKTIPDMMIEPKWRRKLRMLVLNYLTDKTLHPKVRNR